MDYESAALPTERRPVRHGLAPFLVAIGFLGVPRSTHAKRHGATMRRLGSVCPCSKRGSEGEAWSLWLGGLGGVERTRCRRARARIEHIYGLAPEGVRSPIWSGRCRSQCGRRCRVGTARTWGKWLDKPLISTDSKGSNVVCKLLNNK